jgi:hypothetical protein
LRIGVGKLRVVRPWIVEFARDNDEVQLHSKLSNMGLPLQDFVFDVGVELLQYLSSARYVS